MTSVIKAIGLTRGYGARRGIVDVSLEVSEGEVFGFLGPNGAGKTTAIRTLLGLLRPTSGRATVFGLDVWSEAPRVHERLAYLPSEPGYLPELTAAQQLDHICRLRGLEPGAWRACAERFELDASIPIRKLSRGNRQKVGVVQAFMGEAPLLVLDEPTSGLDPLMQREFLSALSETRQAGRTVFLSSHNLPEVERSCDRVAIIRDGRLVETTSIRTLLAGHWRSVDLVLEQAPTPGMFDMPGVRVVSQSARDVHLMVRGEPGPLLRLLAKLDVEDVSITTPELEDVFLRLYGAGSDEGPVVSPGSAP